MKKLATVAMAVLVSVNAFAWTGNGNENLEYAKAYKSDQASYHLGYWLGAISAYAEIYSEAGYDFRICYPRMASAGQLADIAADYMINNPDQRHKSLSFLVWKSHIDAFGMHKDGVCPGDE